MQTWVARFAFDRRADADQLDAWEDELIAHDGVVSQNERGIEVSVYVEAVDPVSATAQAHTVISTVVKLPATAIEVVTEAEHARRADAPTLPELVSAPEVGELLGVSRQRVHQLRSTATFPKPLFELRTGPVWDAVPIRKFAEEWQRKPGRPRKNCA
ncbi:helix-turn-helix transcriptional regulator [Nocardia asteroides]